MAHESLGTGRGGKKYEDRLLANEVRGLTLTQCLKELKKGKGRLYEALLVKLAGSALPRLNEHTGEDGQPIVLNFDRAFAPQTEGNSQ